MFDSYARAVGKDALSLTTTVPQFTPGTRTHQSGNEYVYVYNAAANSQITTGQYAVIDRAGGTSFTSGYSVTITNSSQAGYPAGVAQNTFATGAYGWLMVRGYSLIALDSGEVSMAANVNITTGDNGGFVAAGATFSTAPRWGYTINSAVTTVGTGKAWINCAG